MHFLLAFINVRTAVASVSVLHATTTVAVTAYLKTCLLAFPAELVLLFLEKRVLASVSVSE